MSTAEPPQGANAPSEGSVAAQRGGGMSTAEPPQGANAPSGGSVAAQAAQRGGGMSLMPKPHIRIVVAYADNRVIGRDNQLPWHLSGDLKHFRQTTMGQPIIMGRKTWESLGRALPGRHNIVVTRNRTYTAEGATVVASLEDALRAAAADTVCIIGGAQLYAQALPLATEIVATEVHTEVAGDAFFPALAVDAWRETTRLAQAEENGLAYDFVVYQRAPTLP